MATRTLATRQQATARAAALGCTLDDDGGCMRLDLPVGWRLAYNERHWMDWYSGGMTDLSKPEIWGDLLESLSMGLEPCDDPDCDCCHPVED